jgi:hypothetical protein
VKRIVNWLPLVVVMSLIDRGGGVSGVDDHAFGISVFVQQSYVALSQDITWSLRCYLFWCFTLFQLPDDVKPYGVIWIVGMAIQEKVFGNLVIC